MARGGSYLIEKEGDAPKLVEAPTADAPPKHKADGSLADAAPGKASGVPKKSSGKGN